MLQTLRIGRCKEFCRDVKLGKVFSVNIKHSRECISLLSLVMSSLVCAVDVVQLCAFGDKLIIAQAARIYKSKKIQKGIAFPTCISVNETVCHCSPFPEDTFALKEGDVVKM